MHNEQSETQFTCELKEDERRLPEPHYKVLNKESLGG